MDLQYFESTPDYRGYVEIDLNACLIAFSTLFFGIRVYVRHSMTKSLGLDDGIAAVSFVCLLKIPYRHTQTNLQCFFSAFAGSPVGDGYTWCVIQDISL